MSGRGGAGSSGSSTGGLGSTKLHKVFIRYSDVSTMHEELLLQTRSCAGRGLPEPPPKTTTRRFDGPFLQMRVQQMQGYFDALCSRPAVMALRPVRRLLQLGEGSDSLSDGISAYDTSNGGVGGGAAWPKNSCKTESLPVQVAAVRTKNVVDFCY
ncbi:unnamed protein product, partial [Amoebophrya sp. A25]|eukprot:GSA25T00005891001.1